MIKGLYADMSPRLAKLVIGYRKWWRLDQLTMGYVVHRMKSDPSKLLASLRQKSSDLVILGTGNSINSRSQSFWSELETKATIGVNDFVCHDFIPDAYSIEMYSLAAHTSYVLGEMSKKSPSTPALVKVPWWGTTSKPLLKINWTSRDLYLQTGVPLTCESEESLRSELIALHSMRRAEVCANRPADLISSVFRLAYSAAYSGFRTITLLGIADSSVEYFWSGIEDHPLHDLKKRENALILGEAGSDYSGHVRNQAGNLTLASAIHTLASFAKSELGVEILISASEF